MDWRTAATLSVTVLVAIAGYLTKYYNDVNLARRKDRLERINRQLNELYGPLLALASSGATTWHAFRRKYRPGRPFWGTYPPPTDKEAAAYRLWMKTVFMPLNEEMADIVIHKADLLEESEIPKVLLTLCAHVASHRAVLHKWQEDDFSEHTFGLNFPSGIEEYASSHFGSLKKQQKELLGKL